MQGKGLGGATQIVVNNLLLPAADIWTNYSSAVMGDQNGEWCRPKEDLVVNSFNSDTGRIEARRIKHLYREKFSGFLREVRFSDGSCLTTAAPNQLFTDKGWRSDITVGDYVAIPEHLVAGDATPDRDLVEFLAWTIAEGHESRYTIAITQQDRTPLDDIQPKIKRYLESNKLPGEPKVVKYPSGTCHILRLSSKPFKEHLETLGYKWGRLSKDKEIPQFIIEADNDTAKLFLRAFFSAEAAVNARLNIEVTSASERIADTVRFMLLRFGIRSTIRLTMNCATNGSRIKRPYYKVTLMGRSARDYIKKIGFSVEEKTKRLDKLFLLKESTNVDVMPVKWLLKDFYDKTQVPYALLGIHKGYHNGKHNPSKEYLAKMIAGLEELKSGATERKYKEASIKQRAFTLKALEILNQDHIQLLIDRLNFFYRSETRWVGVTSIKDTPYSGYLYDLDIPTTQNYVADNILCHNTTLNISE